MRVFLVLAICCLGLRPELSAQRDTTFIQLFDNIGRVNTGLRYRDRGVAFRAPTGEELKLNSQTLAFRIGGRYRFASYTFSIPILDLEDNGDGQRSGGFGLGLTLFMREQLLSGRFKTTRGFRTTTSDGTTVFRDDTDLFAATLYGFRVLNHRNYSLRAAFKQRDRQLKSAGSFLIGGLVDRQVLTSTDGIETPLEDGNFQLLTRLAQTKIGIGVGYAHTFLMGDHFFVTPFAIAGPEFRFIRNDAVIEGTEQDNVRVSPRLRSYLAVGHNGKKTAVALTVSNLPAYDDGENLDIKRTNFTVELRITRRLGFGRQPQRARR